MTEDLLRPLLLEMQKNNAFQKQLLAQKLADDTPKQLLMSNLFEIINARLLHTRIVKELDDVEDASKGTAAATAEQLTGSKDAGSFLSAVNTSDLNVTNQLERMIRGLEVVGESVILLGETITKQFDMSVVPNLIRELSLRGGGTADIMSGIEESVDKMKSSFTGLRARVAQGEFPFASDMGDTGTASKDDGNEIVPKGKTKPASKAKEDAKEEKTFLQKITGAITEPITTVGNIFEKVGEKFTVKNTLLATLISAGILILLNASKGFQELIRTTILAFKNFFSTFIPGTESSVMDMTAGQVGIIIGTILFFARNRIKAALLKATGSATTAAMLKGFAKNILLSTLGFVIGAYRFLLLGANPFLLLGGIAVYFFDEIKSIMSSLLNFIGNKIRNLFGFGDTDFMKDASDFYGNLFSGAKDTEVKPNNKNSFTIDVPGAAGALSNMSSPTIINNNMITQSNNASHNHQHSNVSITDSQQEVTGL